jgi:flagellar motor switch protein FliN/FliY
MELLGDVQADGASGAGSQAEPAGSMARNLEMVMRIPVSVKIVLGSATMPVSNLVKLGRGAVIPLDRRVGEPVDVMVNGRIVARGEVVVMDEDNSRFGISLTEIVGPSAADKST